MKIIFDKPSKTSITLGEITFEYNGEEKTIKDKIICDYKGITF